MRAVWVIRRRTLLGILAALLLVATLGLLAAVRAWRGEPSASLTHGPAACGLPGLPDPTLYSVPTADGLAWSVAPPPALLQLQAELAAPVVVGAYQIHLRELLFEEAANVRLGAALLQGQILRPGERFSFNERVGPYTYERGFRDGPEYRGGQVVAAPGGGICKVASALFNAAVLAGLTIEERHPHSMQVPYVPPGQDAAITYPSKDLRLRNDRESPVILWAEVQDRTLTVALYGGYEPPLVEWHHQILERVPHGRIRRPQANLATGQERVAIQGLDGLRIRSWLTTIEPDGRRHQTDLGITLYHPRPEVVEYAP